MPEPTETEVLSAVLQALRYHQSVAWCQRMNSGAGKLTYPDGKQSRFLRFGFPGCPDIIGQLKDGRFLAVEVKRPSGDVSPDQAAFLEMVRKNGGVGFVARRVEDVWVALNDALSITASP